MAVLEQSRALTTLVGQLQSGDLLLILTKAAFQRLAQGREKLQSELSARSGKFMLSVIQLAMRRMRPASPMPISLSQIAATDFSMVSYLERFGGYGNQRELGTILYALSFVMDAAVREDMAGVQEHLALLYVAIEQANLLVQFLLLDDPPLQLWIYTAELAIRCRRGELLLHYAPSDGQRYRWLASRRSTWPAFAQEEKIPKAKRRRRSRQFLDSSVQQSVIDVACDSLATSVGDLV